MKPFTILDELIASPATHNSTAHSTISNTNPTPTTNYRRQPPITVKKANPPPHRSSEYYDTNLPLPQCPPPQHRHYIHPMIHNLYQLTINYLYNHHNTLPVTYLTNITKLPTYYSTNIIKLTP